MSGPEIIVDSFAGGGGASTGIEMALGRSPDVAINHNAEALALHRANHPGTLHLEADIWHVDPAQVAAGRKIGLLWASPDCKHFSKAKGAAVRDRNVRDLAWIVCRYAELPAACRPRVIILENVEEFVTWGPVGEDGRPVAEFRGMTFDLWVRRLRAAGYRVQWRELRACDYGAPTIRKRLFVIARNDGRRIVWPRPTHGAPASEAVRRGARLPWRTAAECIDWSIPCPSIFDTAEEIMAKLGVRAKRPLAEATLRRIARGVMRYVVESPRPFIVRSDMASAAARNGVHGVDEPTRTQTTGGSFALVSPCLVPRYGERPGQEPRCASVEGPAPVVVPTGNGAGLVAAYLAQHNGGEVGREARAPLSTLTAKGSHQQLVAALLTKFHGESAGAPADAPAPTITANSYVKRPGGAAPIGLVAASIMRQFGTSTGHAADAPAGTITCGGQGKSALVAAFLTKYYRTGDGAALGGPLHTDTTKDRFGLVTVEIDGVSYAIVDIGMRMLTPRERFRAQGFPEGYRIDEGVGADGRPVRLTLDAQGRACGNSVCPPIAAALVAANVAELALGARVA